MTPLLSFVWPNTLIELGVVLALAIVLRIALRRVINSVIGASLRAGAKHRVGGAARAEVILAHLGGAASERHEARIRTLGSVLKNAVDVILIVVTTLTMMRVLGMPLEPLLASAGIGGVALAFGAQSLVRDYLSGIFMIMEDQFGVGDFIDTGQTSGTVEEVGLRITRLRDAGGQVWYIRNGEILRVGNQSQGWSTATVDVPIAWNEDAAAAIGVLDRVVDEVHASEKWKDVLLERPNVAGVNEVYGGAATLRIVAKCAPGQAGGVQRDLLERAVAALREAGISAPTVLPPVAPPT